MENRPIDVENGQEPQLETEQPKELVGVAAQLNDAPASAIVDPSAQSAAQASEPASRDVQETSAESESTLRDMDAPLDERAAMGESQAQAPTNGIPDASGSDREEVLEQSGPAAEQEVTMAQLLESSSTEYKTLRRNEVLDGTIMGFDRDGLLIDVGSKSEGVVPSGEMSSLSEEERQALDQGSPVLVSVVDANENNEGHIVLSIDRARAERSWRDLQKQLDSGEVVEAPVVGYNKGGLLVELGGVRGFVPASQVSQLTGGGEEQRQAELAAYGGRTIAMKVIEVNRRRNRLILSERQATQERRESRKERLLEELTDGQIILGTVTSLADFGAFVDVGGADGLIHLSELSWSRVNHPRDVLKAGDKVTVMVLNVDREHRKIALSAKKTQPEPWSTALDRYEVGQTVTGVVTQVAPFGAFVRLEDGIEGLVHVSELSDQHVSSPGAVVKDGDSLRLKVIRIDTQRKRIGLSLRQALAEQEDEYATEYEDQVDEAASDPDQEVAPTATTPVEAGEAEASAPVGADEATDSAPADAVEAEASAPVEADAVEASDPAEADESDASASAERNLGA